MRSHLRRFRVWHGMALVAVLALVLGVSGLGTRWRSYRHHAVSLSRAAERDRFHADFLAKDVESLRVRPQIESWEGWMAYSRERMIRDGVADFPINHEDWVEAYRRDASGNRAEAARLLSEAAMMDRTRARLEAQWW